ncbi:DUF1992 domain-containing protein [uncultured Roseobacter sp.]|uniref:DnaJ family domain-containing protein n=1 Tax=uncultured Roseobacter sp. TaxID=114847 RepID=UPI00262AE9B2|nr:DUF1992 domain-containing protein [uncultured Roseobacter sp.]
MTRSFRSLIERQIQKAKLQGQLDNLEGEGKPLPDRTAETQTDAAEAAGFRIMAQAGVLPQEFEIKKKIDALFTRLRTIVDEDERQEVMKEISRLDLRYNIAREARQRFMRH